MVLGIDLEKVYLCMGDTEGDVENPVLKAEQESQVGKGSRGDVTILPTLVVNNRQYRGTTQSHTKTCFTYLIVSDIIIVVLGKLEKGAVLKAICAGFQESTEPSICLTEGYISLKDYSRTLLFAFQ